MSLGITGTPAARLTCVPACPSRCPPTVDMFAGGVAVGVAPGVGLGAATAGTGAVSAADSRAAEVTSRVRLAVFLVAGTTENVHVLAREVVPPLEATLMPTSMSTLMSLSPPRPPAPVPGGDTEPMKLSRPVSWFLLAFGVWSWVIWVTFIKNLVKDGSGLAFDDAGAPTAYFWVHLVLAVVSFVLGTIVGGIGLRGLRALRQTS